MKQQLKKYADLQRAIKNFQEAHADVFAQWNELEESADLLENEIKEVAKETMEDAEANGVKVTVSPRYKKWYDYKKLSEDTRKLLEKNGAIKHEVNREMFEQLVHEDKIDKAERAKAFNEELQTVAVSIKLVEEK